MNEEPIERAAVCDSSQKRSMQEASRTHRPKRAKYTRAACDECKRCKVKCIQFDEEADCQRCSAMRIACVVVPTATQSSKNSQKELRSSSCDRHQQKLAEDVGSLRRQLNALEATVASFLERESTQLTTPDAHSVRSYSQSTRPPYASTAPSQNAKPVQPQFIGPTRSAYSFNIAETALNRMGFSKNSRIDDDQISAPASPDPVSTSALGLHATTPNPDSDSLLNFSNDEIARLIGIYQEEVVCCHPILDTNMLLLQFPEILKVARCRNFSPAPLLKVGVKDVHLLRLVVATAITHECQGKNETCNRLIAAVEQGIGAVSSDSEIELRDIQTMAMLSIYFCHIEEELLSWRAIGRAVRQCLEIGLHRKQSLIDQYTDKETRDFAMQVFWVVYELDRRWSFGTSLPFALNDRDIDANLPEPGKEQPYLQCMIDYGRLSSKVWDALPPYGSSSSLIPREIEDYLDFVTQNWLLSLPSELQFRHPRLGLAPRTQPRVLHRLRTLCYLRGNYMRLLIHRHHLLNAENIRKDEKSARLVVDIAKDTIEVLVHLNETSDIYTRQQAIYHFYLLGGLAVMLLAVCHAPGTFATSCRDSFTLGIELVKGFSRHSSASRRLWKSIRGLLPIVRSLNTKSVPGDHSNEASTIENNLISETSAQHLEPLAQIFSQQVAEGENTQASDSLWIDKSSPYQGNPGTAMPDILNLSGDLMYLYNAFGSVEMEQPTQLDSSAITSGFPAQDADEILRYFQDLM